MFVGSNGLCVSVCVCSVIYSEARSASSCPNGVPMTLPAADLHHTETERVWGGWGGDMDCGKVNIIFNLLILLDFLASPSEFFSQVTMLQASPRSLRLFSRNSRGKDCLIFTFGAS